MMEYRNTGRRGNRVLIGIPTAVFVSKTTGDNAIKSVTIREY